jgi:hypothetical protein
MADILETGMTWLRDQLKTHRAKSVTYKRGAQSVVVSATIGRTLVDTEDDNGLTIRAQVRDYLIQAADLVLAGQPVLPLRGDQIIEVDGATTYTHEVLPLGPAEEMYRWSDEYHKLLRIHTKQIS